MWPPLFFCLDHKSRYILVFVSVLGMVPRRICHYFFCASNVVGATDLTSTKKQKRRCWVAAAVSSYRISTQHMCWASKQLNANQNNLFINMIGVFGYSSAATLFGPHGGEIYGMSLPIRGKMRCMYAAMLSASLFLGMESPAN